MLKKFAKNAIAVLAAMALASAHAELTAPTAGAAVPKIAIKMDSTTKLKVQGFVDRVTRGEAIPECAQGKSTQCSQSTDLSRLWVRGFLTPDELGGLWKFVLIIVKDKDGSVSVVNAQIYPTFIVKGFSVLPVADSGKYFAQDFKQGCWPGSSGSCPSEIVFVKAVK